MTTPTTELTPRMRDLVRAVATLTERRGFAPSLVEVADQLGVHPSRVQALARAAEARGAIARTPRVARSMRVLPAPSTRRK